MILIRKITPIMLLRTKEKKEKIRSVKKYLKKYTDNRIENAIIKCSR